MNSGSNVVVANIDYSCLYQFRENGTVTHGDATFTVYVLYNVANGKYLAGNNSYTEDINAAFQLVPGKAVTATNDEINNASDWTFYHNKTRTELSGTTETLWTFCKKDDKTWLTVIDNPGVHAYSDTNLWLIYSVTDDKIESAALTAAKENACAKVDELAPLSTLASSEQLNSIKGQINAVTSDGDINAAIATINGLTATAFGLINNKSIIFSNLRDDARKGLHITAGNLKGTDLSKAFGTQTTDKNRTIWTIKNNDNGTFKLFNLFTGKYLGVAPEAANGAALSTNAADGANFTFVIRGENAVSLKDDNGNIFHQMSYSSPDYLYKIYNSNDAASNWTIEAVEIASEELYTAYQENVSSYKDLAYTYFQEKYGLVKDGDKIEVVVDHPDGNDHQPSSNLLDGNRGTYVHSSYDSNTMGTDPHYIQAELSEAQQHIMFYMAKRNDSNRPYTVKVYVSEDGNTFGTDPVATLNNLSALGDPYYSPAIDLGASYKYVRFVVTETNTGTLYFTASEFYILPVNDETKGAAAHDVTQITDELVSEQSNTIRAIRLGTSLKKAQAYLDENTNNKADVPALGQYTTTAYNALQAAVNNDDITLEGLNEAIANFEKGQNRPLFIFTSAFDNGYSANSSIYDDNSTAWKWTTRNYYNKSMLFSVKDLTEKNMTVGTPYNIYNYVSGRPLYYEGTVTPEQVAGKEGVYNLKVNTEMYYLHCKNNKDLVTWYACSLKDDGTYDNSASSWRIEYVGNSYDLDQITDFPVSANELMAITMSLDHFKGGMNQFSVTNPETLEAAYNAVVTLQDKEKKQFYSITNTQITDALTALNNALSGATMVPPATGKFYRIKNVASGKYLTSTITNSRMTMEEATNAYNTRQSVFYLTEDNKLLSYENGLMTQNFTSDNGGKYNFEAAGHEGHAIAFDQGNPATVFPACYTSIAADALSTETRHSWTAAIK